LVVFEQHIQKCSKHETKVIKANRLYLKPIPQVRICSQGKRIKFCMKDIAVMQGKIITCALAETSPILSAIAKLL
jgi:hypothetical protein